jgi:RHS repeat-associated protein
VDQKPGAPKASEQPQPQGANGGGPPGEVGARSAGTGYLLPAVSVPRGGGAIRGIGEKFATNPVTGTGSLTIPIPLSPGRGFGPDLTLTYDSGAGNGPFGFGWGLPHRAITRKTDKGLPQYRDAEESDVFLLGDIEDLVPFLGPDGHRLQDETSAPGYTIHRYRPRIEGLFVRIERWTEHATGDVHWRSITRDNVTHVYGRDGDSCIFDPADPVAAHPTRLFSWLLCQSWDDKGNAIVYDYVAEDDAQLDHTLVNEHDRVRSANRYVKRIRYGNRTSHLVEPDLTVTDWLFEVVFDYDEGHIQEFPLDGAHPEAEQHRYVYASTTGAHPWAARPDPFSSYRSGFEVRTHRRCRRVLVFHSFPELGVGPCLVRSVAFDYADLDYGAPVTIDDELAHPGSTRLASFLCAVTQSGYVRDGGRYLVKSLPPAELTYSRPTVHDAALGLDRSSVENLPVGLDGTTYRFVDLDGEGIAGILTAQADGWLYKTNLGDGHFGPIQTVATTPGFAALGSGGGGWEQLIDLAGDGQLDLVAFAGPTAGFHDHTPQGTWEPFRPFRQLPNVGWDDPNLRFVDLDGDGHADLLITDDDVFTWYPSFAEEGFGAARQVRAPSDEARGPRLVLADGTQSVYLADMSGDGLSDLVRIRNGDICYWPNLGYGRFGAKVTMDDAPWLATPEAFDQRRVRLADIDGSGTSDLIYLAEDGVRLYFNQSGNRWSRPRRLATFPAVDDLSSVAVADLLGNGTACLVWSSPLARDAHSPLRYVDLMGGAKPHLLLASVNNQGAETRIQYASSTKFYLADKRAGMPWVTKLPFPVHVVERVDTLDRISRNRFVTRYAYRDGYFDGVEREFRGFGLVEQRDTEELAALSVGQQFPDATNLDAASHVPPVLTKTWFDTGRYIGRGPTAVPPGLTLDEEREACRALKGTLLRREVYALDGTPREALPYLVTEQTSTLRLLQARGENRHAVFYPHDRGSVTWDHERAATEPRVRHALTLAVDDAGNVLRSAEVTYGRKAPDPTLPPEDQATQARTLITCAEHDFTKAVDSPADHRTPLPCETRRYEVTGLPLALGHDRFTFDEIDTATATAAPIAFEVDPTPGKLEKRLFSQVRIIYRRDDLVGPLKLGELQSLALPFERYELALTARLVSAVLSGRASTTMIQDEARYVHSEADADWWVPSGRIFYSPDPAHTALQEVVYARAHFFLSLRSRDPFHTVAVSTERFVAYDAYDILVEETRDALGNRVTVGERDIDPTKPLVTHGQDYRVLQPALVMDPNRNRSAGVFDALGVVVGSAVMGKPEDLPVPGDRLGAAFDADLTQAQIDAFFANPTGPVAATLLGTATTRVVYDTTGYRREPDPLKRPPAFVATLARETHASDPVPPGGLRIQASVAHVDGFGREIQRKLRADPGPVPGHVGDVTPRWVGSGWTVFDNKGNPVRRYEPFFSDTHRFQFDAKIGVSPTVFYDPLERVVGRLHPNHTWEKTVFDPWRCERSDVNDTVAVADPSTDPDVGEYFHRLSAAEYLPTWSAQRALGGLGPEEQDAARKASVHAGTPVVTHVDARGRVFLTEMPNRLKYSDTPPADPPAQELHRTRLQLDIQGDERAITDPRDRVVARYDLDLRGNRIHQASMSAGARWMLDDIAGKPLYAWDSRDHRLHHVYDSLRRPTDTFLRVGAGGETLVERTIHGEGQPNPDASNLRGRVYELRDQAGVLTTDAYDFKGNLRHGQRQLAQKYDITLDWSGAVPLDAPAFVTQARHDALNRPVELTAPDTSVIRTGYNEAGLPQQVHVNLRGELAAGSPVWTPFVVDIDYNAKGQRARIEHGNGVTTVSTYDPLTFRLTQVVTDDLQDLHYTYDPAGNVTNLRDDAQQTHYFKNRKVDPGHDYVYDAVYRLIEATGREHLGLAGGSPIPHSYNDLARVGLAHPSDGNALGRYLERYRYDLAGNVGAMQHRGTDPDNPGWSRDYFLDEASSIEPAKKNDRLTRTTVGATTEIYSNAGDGYDAHGNMLRMLHLQVMQWDHRDQLRMTRRQAISPGDTDGVAHDGERTWYVYNAAGQRVRKVTELAAGVRKDERIYLGVFEIYRRYGAKPLVRETLHVMDGKRRVALVETRTDTAPAETLIRYQFGNHLGSATLELDDAGKIISYEEYTPAGSTSYQAVRSLLETPKRYCYTAKERDEESGLYYHGVRYYAPWLERWTSCDPAGLIDGLNLYAYVQNNPVRRVDQLGLEGEGDGEDKEHTKNARRSTKDDHEEGRARVRREKEKAQEKEREQERQKRRRNPDNETEEERRTRLNEEKRKRYKEEGEKERDPDRERRERELREREKRWEEERKRHEEREKRDREQKEREEQEKKDREEKDKKDREAKDYQRTKEYDRPAPPNSLAYEAVVFVILVVSVFTIIRVLGSAASEPVSGPPVPRPPVPGPPVPGPPLPALPAPPPPVPTPPPPTLSL